MNSYLLLSLYLNVNLNMLLVCGEFTTEAIPAGFTPEPDVVLYVSKVKTTHPTRRLVRIVEKKRGKGLHRMYWDLMVSS